MDLRFRAMTPTDYGYVLDSWVGSLYDGRDDLKALTSKAGFAELAMCPHRRVLDRLDVIVCEVDGVLVGWVATSRKAVWYVYVAKAWRRRGVARALINRTCASTHELCACITRAWAHFAGAALVGPYRWEPKLWAAAL